MAGPEKDRTLRVWEGLLEKEGDEDPVRVKDTRAVGLRVPVEQRDPDSVTLVVGEALPLLDWVGVAEPVGKAGDALTIVVVLALAVPADRRRRRESRDGGLPACRLSESSLFCSSSRKRAWVSSLTDGPTPPSTHGNTQRRKRTSIDINGAAIYRCQ